MPGDDHPPRVALVTGAASGIGRACCRRLAEDGFTVVAGWRTRRPDGPGPAVRFDVTRSDEVDGAVAEIAERLGPVEVLVSNAGRAHLDLGVRVDADTFAGLVATNLAGSFHLARAVAPAMAARRRGRIVLVGSAAGHWGVPGVGGYAAAKAGLVGLARSLARELGPRGVTVNVVAPGMLDDAADRLHARRRPEVIATWREATPARRQGTAEEVAAAVSFLAGAGAGVTGAVVPIDGGFASGLA